KLLGKDAVIADVVAQRGHERVIVSKGDDPEARLAGDSRALGEVTGKVGGRGGAAPVTADEDGLPGVIGLDQHFNNRVHRVKRSMIKHSLYFIKVVAKIHPLVSLALYVRFV